MGDDRKDSASGAPARVDFAGINALSSRAAGYAVALKCLQIQADAEDADPSLRTTKRAKLVDEAWPWYQGALGEIEVGRMLGELGPEWFVRHSVPIGADTKDVDHLVIGPNGVFAINTKHHAGASVWVGDHVLRVNNGNTRHLRQAHDDGADVSRRLASRAGFPVPVRSVIAVLDARSIKDSRPPHDRAVSVVDARKLVSWLRAQPAQLGTTKIDLLKLEAEEPETWHVDPRAADTLRMMQRFERLVARVGTPVAPAVHATRTAPARPPAAARRPPRPTRARPAAARTFAFPDIIRVWLITAFIIVGMLVFRGMADQPCAPHVVCVLPTVYSVWKPLMVLLGIGVVGRAAITTIRLLIRPGPTRRRR